jgi:hypothetical protein
MTSEEIIPMLRKSAEALTKATNDLGNKATWSPMEKGRTAINQVAECAILTSGAVHAFETGTFPSMDQEAFGAMMTELSGSAEQALAALAQHTEKVCVALGASSAEKLATTVTLPWGTIASLEEVAMMMYWNNTYHEGQINYISTLVG